MPDCTVSAPGKPLKRLSTVRFSCRMMTTCWIFSEAGLGGFPWGFAELLGLEPPHPARKAHPRSAAPKAVRTILPPLKKIERPLGIGGNFYSAGCFVPSILDGNSNGGAEARDPSGRPDSEVPPAQMILKPARGQGGCLFQCSRLFKQMRRVRDYFKPLFSSQLFHRLPVQVEHGAVVSAHDQQHRGAYPAQRISGQIRPASTGNHCSNLVDFRSRLKCRRGAGAG